MATLAGGFGLLALTLACVGLYGLLAYSVAQRTERDRHPDGARRPGIARRRAGAQGWRPARRDRHRAWVAGGVGGVALGGVDAVWLDADRSRSPWRSSCGAGGGRTARRVPAGAPGVASGSGNGSASGMMKSPQAD